MTVAELCQRAGCPWQAFFEGYLQGRSNAIKSLHKLLKTGKKESPTQLRQEIVLAASKGMDGLDHLMRSLELKCGANDMLAFKLCTMMFSGCTFLAQFFPWGDYISTDLASPIWQTQIGELHSLMSELLLQMKAGG